MEKMLAANYQYRRSSMPINSLTGWNAGSGVTNTGGHSITAGGHSAGGINNNSIGGLNTTAHGHPAIGGSHAPPHNQRGKSLQAVHAVVFNSFPPPSSSFGNEKERKREENRKNGGFMGVPGPAPSAHLHEKRSSRTNVSVRIRTAITTLMM